MSELVDHVLELLEPFGDVSARRMFGGHGLFRDGVMFALEADDVLYFKVDDKTRPEFDKRELTPFEYARNGNSVTLSYRMAPEEAMNNSKVMCRWAKDAFDAAVRTNEVNRAAEAEARAEAETPNKAISDTARLQAVSLPAQANGNINPMLAAQASPAEVAAKLAEQRKAAEAAEQAGNAKIVGAVKAVSASAKLGKDGELAANSKAGKAAVEKSQVAKPAVRKRPTKNKSVSRSVSAKASRVNGVTTKPRAERVSGATGVSRGPLRKTINRRAAVILTRSMLGLSADH